MMKKLFTLVTLCLMSIPSLLAQTFEFRYHGETLADGATVTIQAVEDEYGEEGEMVCETNPVTDPNNGLILQILSGTETSGTATIAIEENSLNPTSIKWCMGGECSILNGKTFLTKNFTANNGIVQAQFDAGGITNEGVLIATLTATIGEETHSVTIKFVNGEQTDDGIWWGYFTEDDANSDDLMGLGVSSKADYEAAIRIPANQPIVGNSKIKAIRIWLGESTIPKLNSLKVWVSKTLKNNASGVNYVKEVDLATLQAGANDIFLDSLFNINNGSVYVGYTMGMNSKDYPVMCAGEWETNSFYIRASVSVTTWQALSDYGKLALQILVEGADVGDNSASPSDFGSNNVVIGQEAMVPVKIKNIGKNKLSSISYTITTNDDPATTTPETTVSLNNLSFNSSKTINIPFAADEETKKHSKTLTITKVNGEANEAASPKNMANGTLITLTEKPNFVPVVEEFTGTWCGWCPRGFVGMEYAQETYGDKVVLIAVHGGSSTEPMRITEYNTFINNYVGGYPDAWVNRKIETDPNPDDLLYYIDQVIEETTVGEINVIAQWSDATKTKINIDTDTKFAYTDDNAKYAIAFVVTEDGLSGTGSNWSQSNYYSGGSGYDDPDYMSFWVNSPSSVSGLEFDHVAVWAESITNGNANALKKSFTAGESMGYNYVADISAKTVIQDKDKLKVVALLIDQNTKQIVNAAQTIIKAAVPGDVNGDGVCNAADVTALYNWILDNNDSALKNGDQNHDGVINAGDVTTVYNIILGNAATSQNVYVVGEVNGNIWGAATGVKMNTTDGKVFSAQITTTTNTESTTSYFALTKALASADDKWDEIEDKRFGPTSSDPNFVINDAILGQEIPLVTTGWQSLQAPTGEVYNFTVDLEHMTLVITKDNS